MSMPELIDKECAIYIDTEHCAPIDVLHKINDKSGAQSAAEFDDPKKIIDDLKQQTNCTTELCVIESHKVKNILGRDLVNKIIDQYFKTYPSQL